MGDALHAAGWDVIAVGLPGARTPAPPWRIDVLAAPVVGEAGPAAASGLGAAAWKWSLRALVLALDPVERLLRATRSRGAQAFAMARSRAWEDPPAAARALGRLPYLARKMSGRAGEAELLADFDRLWPSAVALARHTQNFDAPGLWIANDWQTLQAATTAARRTGGVAVYDSHELAVEEYAERRFWRWMRRPVVAAVERRYIQDVALVTAVSEGIAKRLAEDYQLTAPASAVRNAPVYRALPFRATGATVGLLYHGVVSPGRGLEACIDAIALLPERFALTIRGPSGLPDYIPGLKARAEAAGVAERVTFAEPVPMTQLVEAASAFDIGLMILPGHSLHNRLALPNKVFEYMMAGLALCVSDLPEMADLAVKTGAGFIAADTTAPALASALAGLTTDDIDRAKHAALEAARRYNWDVESDRVLALYAELVDGRPKIGSARD